MDSFIKQVGPAPSGSSQSASTEILPHGLDDLLTQDQTADLLQVASGTLAVWRSSGRYPLKYVKVGRWVRYRYRDILSFIESRTFTQVD